MNKQAFAEKMKFIPLVHLYSLWFFVRNNKYLDFLIVAFAEFIIFMILCCIFPYVPDSIIPIFSCAGYYIVFQSMILIARYRYFKRFPKK